jgi:hypothetical protein
VPVCALVCVGTWSVPVEQAHLEPVTRVDARGDRSVKADNATGDAILQDELLLMVFGLPNMWEASALDRVQGGPGG